jgi:hypothetical protein
MAGTLKMPPVEKRAICAKLQIDRNCAGHAPNIAFLLPMPATNQVLSRPKHRGKTDRSAHSLFRRCAQEHKCRSEENKGKDRFHNEMARL